MVFVQKPTGRADLAENMNRSTTIILNNMVGQQPSERYVVPYKFPSDFGILGAFSSAFTRKTCPPSIFLPWPRWLSCPRWSHRMRARCAGSWLGEVIRIYNWLWKKHQKINLDEVKIGDWIWNDMAILMMNIASVSNQHPFNALRVKNQTTHASTFLPGESFERCKQVFGDETDLAVLQEVIYKKYSTAHAVWKGGNGQWSHLFKDLLWNGSWKKHRVKISAKFQFTYPFSGMNRHSCCLKLHETPQGIMEPATGSFLLSRYGSGLGWYMKHRLFGCMSQSRGIESTAPAKFQSIFPSKMTNWKIPIHFFGSSKSIP